MTAKMARMRGGEVVAHFKASSRHLLEEIEENLDKF
jgi:hypothetical protein